MRQRKQADDKFPRTVYEYYAYKYTWMVPAATGFLILHPLQVIGMQVIYARFNRNLKLRHAFQNSFKCASMIPHVQGLRGFYRGFVPATLAYALVSYEQLQLLMR